jgi:hypothetical protein
MYKHIAFTLISTFCFALGLSAQENGPARTAFTFSEKQSTLQQLFAITESNPHLKELFFLEEQPEMSDGTASIKTVSGPHSFAYGNLTAAEMYAQILQIPSNEIYATKDLEDQRYNLFYHSGGQTMDEELRHQIANRFLESINIKVADEESVVMDLMVFTATQDIEKAFAQVDESGTAWTQNSSFQISVRNKPLSEIFTEIQKHPLFKHYQLKDNTGLAEEQTLDADLSTESIDDFIASAAKQGLEITLEQGKGKKVMLTPQ